MKTRLRSRYTTALVCFTLSPVLWKIHEMILSRRSFFLYFRTSGMVVSSIEIIAQLDILVGQDWMRAKNNMDWLRYMDTDINNCDIPVHWSIFNWKKNFLRGGGVFLKTVICREKNWYTVLVKCRKVRWVGGGGGFLRFRIENRQKKQRVRTEKKHTGFQTIQYLLGIGSDRKTSGCGWFW